jgi:hypothetical protein
MYSKTLTGKNPKGVPSLESFRGRLRIRLRVDGQRQLLTLGLVDTEENRIKAEEIVRRIQIDMLSPECFDPTLKKYKPKNGLTLIQPLKKQEPDGSPVHTVISKSYLNKQANSFSRKEWKLLKP